MSTSPEGFVIEQCRTETCQAPIIWARTKTGKSMPFDAQPSQGGTFRVLRRQGFTYGLVVRGKDLQRARADSEPLYTSHFATCPAAPDWRKR